MLLSKAQQSRFWREWSSIVRLHNWSAEEAETQRHDLLERAGFTSLTLVDKLAGYDRVSAELAAIARPDDLDAQLRSATMPRTRLLFAIGKLSAPMSPALVHLSYACTISRDKFGTVDLESLHDAQLLDLRNTLAARLNVHRRRQRQSASSQMDA